ncbi:unnamed protein product [Nyctereutes procyonoides]|uniref:(raccoon dog) hypothetical protein n=1 Tax=Nyctereutes procyonoides TaxID=34880 RepID=A0A811XUQ2_NYCPR|nr:unnamed protein product [Nyctereutes procyonoides]
MPGPETWCHTMLLGSGLQTSSLSQLVSWTTTHLALGRPQALCPSPLPVVPLREAGFVRSPRPAAAPPLAHAHAHSPPPPPAAPPRPARPGSRPGGGDATPRAPAPPPRPAGPGSRVPGPRSQVPGPGSRPSPPGPSPCRRPAPPPPPFRVLDPALQRWQVLCQTLPLRSARPPPRRQIGLSPPL